MLWPCAKLWNLHENIKFCNKFNVFLAHRSVFLGNKKYGNTVVPVVSMTPVYFGIKIALI